MGNRLPTRGDRKLVEDAIKAAKAEQDKETTVKETPKSNTQS